jgi:1-acyl-sn-glycerol-3-phosphate acyltransferase
VSLQVSLWIFPEGTRSSKPEPGLLPFKKGAFHLAVQGAFPQVCLCLKDADGRVAGVPIIPVVCESYHRLFDGKTRMERGVLKVKGTFTPPYSTTLLMEGNSTAPDLNRRYDSRRCPSTDGRRQGQDVGDLEGDFNA